MIFRQIKSLAMGAKVPQQLRILDLDGYLIVAVCHDG
jgi:hypothetical protein